MPKKKHASLWIKIAWGFRAKKLLYSKADKTDNINAVFPKKTFEPGLVKILSWQPDWLQEPYNWTGHLPFARWLIGKVKPEIFVELGTHTGNSYFSFCEGVREESLKTRCFAVDTWCGDEQAGFYGEEVFQMVQAHNESKYAGFSTLLRTTFNKALGRFDKGTIDLLHIDGLHTYEAVRHDFESWLPKLAPGALVLFHDIKVMQRNFGVFKLWAELKELYSDWLEFDHSHGLGVLQISGGQKFLWLNPEWAGVKALREVFKVAGSRFTAEMMSLPPKERHNMLQSRLAEANAMAQAIEKKFQKEQAQKIKSPSIIARTLKNKLIFAGQPQKTTCPEAGKTGFWRRIEKSIRKRRKHLFAYIGFDKKWYLQNYPDVVASQADPFSHYLEFGIKEGRKKNCHHNPKKKPAPTKPTSYKEWIKLYDTLSEMDKRLIQKKILHMRNHPGFSIVMPVFNPRPDWLICAIDSVVKQAYENWQLCIADDNSTDPKIHQILDEYARKERRISLVKLSENIGISGASNAALTLAKSDWVVFFDHDDELKEDALFWVAQAIQHQPTAAIIYSDEDKIDGEGNRSEPHFKTDWNPSLIFSYNYFCHLLAIKKRLIDEAGGFRLGFDGAQDYDLVLRCIERTASGAIVHIPKILYHWRAHRTSTASFPNAKPNAIGASIKAISEHLHRRKICATVSTAKSGYRVHYKLTDIPKVSIIISTRDQPALLELCVESLLKKTEYPNFEIILIDNGTCDAKAAALLQKYKSNGLLVLRDDEDFNYSRLNNIGSRAAKGDLLLLLNNDVEIRNKKWLENMVVEISQEKVGAVGAKLLYPDGRLQHGGVILGICGVAGHSHKYFASSDPGYFNRCQLVQDLSAVTAACMLVRKDVFLKVGGLDETNLKVAFNDVDLCLRIKEAGWRIVWTPYAELIHHESLSRGQENTPEKHARFVSEINYMQSRWNQKLLQDENYNPNLTLDSENFGLAFPPRQLSIWSLR